MFSPIFLEILFSCEGAALEVTFKLVNQSKSVMSCNGRHSDQLLVNQSKSVMSCNVRHSDQLCLCVRVSPSWSHWRNSDKHYMWIIVKLITLMELGITWSALRRWTQTMKSITWSALWRWTQWTQKQECTGSDTGEGMYRDRSLRRRRNVQGPTISQGWMYRDQPLHRRKNVW